VDLKSVTEPFHTITEETFTRATLKLVWAWVLRQNAGTLQICNQLTDLQ